MDRPRTIVITGANTGIGAAAARELARPGVHLVLACRSEEKTRPVLEQLRALGARASFARLDLGDLGQATAAARALAAEDAPLDLLVDNAGLGGQRGLTKDGYELAFGTNHLGHFAFTLPLLPRLARARGRVVVVSSANHLHPRAIPWEHLREPTRTYTGMAEYGVSKLCNVLFAAELRRRHPEVTAVAMHPGRLASDIWRRVPQPFRYVLPTLLAMQSVEYGGRMIVHACEADLSGADAPVYLSLDRPGRVNPLALREDLASELWDYSARAVAPFAEASSASASHDASAAGGA
jgi:NAD(P)-dependent dehydrogenase (short-subunit alcohol dehydrogenase family)